LNNYVKVSLSLFLMTLAFTNIQAKYVGVSYSNWFSTTDVEPNYITWGGAGEPIGSKVWGVPLVGYYSSKDISIIDQHAEWLSDAGVDFVMMDLSNSGFHDLVAPLYSTDGFKADKYWIEDAAKVFTDRMAWRKSQGLPYVQVAVMVGALGNCDNVTNGFMDKAADIIKTWYINDTQRNSVYFYYKGQPLLAVAVIGCAVYFPQNGGGWGWGDTPLVPFDRNDFSVRHVNDHNALAGLWDPATGQSHKRLWSWGERYLPDNNPPIIPSYMADNGVPEFQIIQAGERGNGGWGGPEGRGREDGQTFRDYWSIARERDVDIALVQSWNEWTGTADNPGEESTPEYSNDIEPSTAHGTFYLDLMKEQIALFKGTPTLEVSSLETFWNFEGSQQGWTLTQGLINNFHSSLLRLTVTQADPQMHSPSNLKLYAGDYPFLQFGMRNRSNDTLAEFFWTRNTGPAFNANKWKVFNIIPNDNAQRTYVVDLNNHATYIDTITQLRFDPLQNSLDGTVNLDFIKFSAAYPIANQPHSVPGIIQAEDFNQGGQGNGYNDISTANQGGAYRPDEGVDIQSISGGGHALGWVQSGEWLDYLIRADSDFSGDILIRAASVHQGDSIQLLLNGRALGEAIVFNAGQGLEDYQDFSTTATMPAGLHVLRIQIIKAAGGLNLDYVEFKHIEAPVGQIQTQMKIDDIHSRHPQRSYDLKGRVINGDTKGLWFDSHKKLRINL
jgi:hypothetical protein